MRSERPEGTSRRLVQLAAFVTFAAVACAITARDAHAFCRTTTCGLPPGFAPTDGNCFPPDFEARCMALTPPAKVLPVYWANACVSYDIQADASVQVPYDAASVLFAAAFAKWTSTTCANDGGGTVSIAVQDLGPVACDQVNYNKDQGNQHVIIFHDDVWPHDDASNTLGLTTITFDPDTGELYDADMEINSTPSVPLSLGDPPADGYDFQSIIAHETGHFLGMAHSDTPDATMVARYIPGTTTMRTLTADDTAGICSIYSPDGNRHVDPSVEPSGLVAESACDATPRHGFQSECVVATTSQCSVSAAPGAGATRGGLGFAMMALGAAAIARRRRLGANDRASDQRMW